VVTRNPAPEQGAGVADRCFATRVLAVLIWLTLGLAGTPRNEASQGSKAAEAGREAVAAFRQRDFSRAHERAERQWELAESQADRFQAGLAAANVAAVLAVSGRVDDALGWYETAADRLRAAGRTRALGRLAVARALAQYARHEAERGERELARARELLGADWRLEYVASALRLWADMEAWQAYPRFEGLLERARQSGDQSRVTATLMALGWVGGDVRHYEEALRLFEARGDTRSVVLARVNLGVISLRSRELDRAETQLVKALDLARRVADPRLEFIAQNDLSIVYARAGAAARAREADLQAEALLGGTTEDLRQGRRQDTVLLDYYHLLRMRYLTRPILLVDPFPWLFDQLVLEPEETDEPGKAR
jgi:tetratricopeptide (TPR) repeat protein